MSFISSVILNENKSYYYTDDIWNIIKDYMGFNNNDFSLNLEKWNLITKKKLNEQTSLSRVVEAIKTTKILCNFGNLTNKRGSIKERIDIVKELFWKQNEKTPFNCFDFKNINRILYPKLNIFKQKTPKILKEGDEIVFYIKIFNSISNIYQRDWFCGIITKIDKYKISVKEYKHHYNINSLVFRRIFKRNGITICEYGEWDKTQFKQKEVCISDFSTILYKNKNTRGFYKCFRLEKKRGNF